MEYSHVTHESLKPFLPEKAKVLILGSLPSIATRKANFYYAHKTNRFYKILAGIYQEEEPLTTEERKAFLTTRFAKNKTIENTVSGTFL